MPRLAVFDFLSEDGYALACEDMAVGYPFDLWSAMQAEKFSVCYRPLEYDPKTQACPGFNQFCSIGYRRGDLWLVIDEAHQFCRPHNIPPDLLAIARLGRHQEVSLLYITQSFTQVERTLTLNTNTFAFFKITDPRDLEGIKMRCGQELAEEVQQLRALDAQKGIAGEVLLWSDTGEKFRFDLNSSSGLDSSTKVLLTGQAARVTMAEVQGHDQRRTLDDPGQRTELRDDLAGDRGQPGGHVGQFANPSTPTCPENQAIQGAKF